MKIDAGPVTSLDDAPALARCFESRRVGDGTFPFATDEERQGYFEELRGT
jgi:hypothetical protein